MKHSNRSNDSPRSRKPVVLLAVLCLVLFGVCLRWLTVPEVVQLDKTVSCVETTTGQPVDVHIKGDYYRFRFGKERFYGTIDVEGYRTCTAVYVFRDGISNFVDEAGQPMGTIQQQNMFETVTIAENDYTVTSAIS